MIKHLGSGSSGEVHLVKLNSVYYTVKIADNCSEFKFWQKHGEIDLCGIPKVHAMFRENHKWVTVFEYAQGECLLDLVTNSSLPKLTYRERHIIITGLMWLITKLHQIGFAHLDIKLENLIFDRTCNKLWLIDFDLTIAKETPHFHLCGSPMYMSPDVWALGDFSVADWNLAVAADTWSVMVCCYMLLTDNAPYQKSIKKNGEMSKLYLVKPLFRRHHKWFPTLCDFLRTQHWVDRKSLAELNDGHKSSTEIKSHRMKRQRASSLVVAVPSHETKKRSRTKSCSDKPPLAAVKK